MQEFKGIIALDIDGTITIDKSQIHEKVQDFLNFLIEDGWQLIFLTGRMFSFAYPVLSKLKGEYYLAVQNGAALYKMPLIQLVKKHYLPIHLLTKLPRNIVIESGKENDDLCYYCPMDFRREELELIHSRISFFPEKWVVVHGFENLDITDFAVGKYFGDKRKVNVFIKKMNQFTELRTQLIRDPFKLDQYIIFLNHIQASKGNILAAFQQFYPSNLPVISAGNDLNDLDMLQRSTFKIVMPDAPEELKNLAHLIAPPVENFGIIDAIKEIIDRNFF
ncbi:MAG: HAD family hydrolase [Chlamydiales bacterium]